MAKHRHQPREVWQQTRLKILERDGYACVRDHVAVTVQSAHIDHIVPLSKGGSNSLSNLRTLCRRCHVLRSDNAHRGMIAAALRDGVIPPDWRSLVWE